MGVHPQPITNPQQRGYDSIWPTGCSALQAKMNEMPLTGRDIPGRSLLQAEGSTAWHLVIYRTLPSSLFKLHSQSAFLLSSRYTQQLHWSYKGCGWFLCLQRGQGGMCEQQCSHFRTYELKLERKNNNELNRLSGSLQFPIN